MRSLPSIHGLSKEMRRQGYEAGVRRAFVMAKAMELNPVVTGGAESSEIAEETKMVPAAIMTARLWNVPSSTSGGPIWMYS